MQTGRPVPGGGIAVSHRWLWFHSSCYLTIRGHHTIAGTSCSKRTENAKGQVPEVIAGSTNHSTTYTSSNTKTLWNCDSGKVMRTCPRERWAPSVPTRQWCLDLFNPSRTGASVLVSAGWRCRLDRICSAGCTSFSGSCCWWHGEIKAMFIRCRRDATAIPGV